MLLDKNDMAFWFPKIEAAGLPVPRTTMLHTNVALASLMDGETPEGWRGFMAQMFDAARPFASPVGINESSAFFLRTGHTSGKHDWVHTCYIGPGEYLSLEHHVSALVQHSVLAGFMGLPVQTWAVRELIPTAPICRCIHYRGMPVVREFRYFVRDGVIEHVQPYWPPDAVEQGKPDLPTWQHDLAVISRLGLDARGQLGDLAVRACEAVGGGFWSVDLLSDEDGGWWLTDMALGDDSFRWDLDL